MEDFVGDDMDPEEREYSPSQHSLGNMLERKRVSIVFYYFITSRHIIRILKTLYYQKGYN
jgi:hypothetical protein